MDRFLDEMDNPLLESQGSAIASQETSSATSCDAPSSTSVAQVGSHESAVALSAIQNNDSSASYSANQQSLSANNKYSGLVKFCEGGLLSAPLRIEIDELVPHGCDAVEITRLTDGVSNHPVSKLETSGCFLDIDAPNPRSLPTKSAVMPSTSIENQPVDIIAVVEPALSLENGVVLKNEEDKEPVTVISTKSSHDSSMVNVCSIDLLTCVSAKPQSFGFSSSAVDELKPLKKNHQTSQISISVRSEDENINDGKVDSTNVNLSLAEDPLITKPFACMNSPVLPKFPALSADLTEIPVETLVTPVDLMMNVNELDVSVDTLVPLVDNKHQINSAALLAGDVKRIKMASPSARMSGIVPFPLPASSVEPKSCASAEINTVQTIDGESASVGSIESILEEPESVPTPIHNELNAFQISSDYNSLLASLPTKSKPVHSVDKTDPHRFETSSDVGCLLTEGQFFTVGLTPFPSIASSTALLTESDSLAKSIESLGSSDIDFNKAASNSSGPTPDLSNLSTKVALEDGSGGVQLCSAITFNPISIKNSNDQTSKATATIDGTNPISSVTFPESSTTIGVPVDLVDSCKSSIADCAELGSVEDSRKVSSFTSVLSDGHVGSSLVSS